jgi:hypothetical protein
MKRNSYPLLALLLCISFHSFAQNGAISGKIIDAKLAEGQADPDDLVQQTAESGEEEEDKQPSGECGDQQGHGNA